MTIHPPMLYLGFTAFTVPFAFAIAALVNGRLDSRWINVTRRWILLSWFFLAIGIVLGMRWAYSELGWGGYWFWDPVENASLLPWLSATAFLHSIQIQESRGMLKVWNMFLVILTFLLTIFATFLTRSGLIESVHSFAQELKIAYIFLAFLSAIAGTGVVLILWRLPKLKSENQIESFLSRESAFLFNNLMLLGVLFAVLWGTLFPLISEGLTGEKISVGPPFFNRVNIPIGLILLALTGIGPVIAWRRASKQNIKKSFTVPVGVGLAVAGGLFAIGVRHGFALATFGISSFVMTVIVIEFFKGTRARARIENENWAVAFTHLIARNRRPLGGLHRPRRRGDRLRRDRRLFVQREHPPNARAGRVSGDSVAFRARIQADLRGDEHHECDRVQFQQQLRVPVGGAPTGRKEWQSASEPHHRKARLHRPGPAHYRGRHPVVVPRGSVRHSVRRPRHAEGDPERAGRPDRDLHLPGESSGGMDLVRGHDRRARWADRSLADRGRCAGARPRSDPRAGARWGGRRLIHPDFTKL